MVTYADKLIGNIAAALDRNGVRDNTLLLVIGDNGTTRGIRSRMGDRVLIGGKGSSNHLGTHVPLVARPVMKAANILLCALVAAMLAAPSFGVTLRGEVVDVGPDSITIVSDGEVTTYPLPEDFRIEGAEQETRELQLRSGQTVVLTVDGPDPLEAEATAAPSARSIRVARDVDIEVEEEHDVEVDEEDDEVDEELEIEVERDDGEEEVEIEIERDSDSDDD
jgi:hypothetical protein